MFCNIYESSTHNEFLYSNTRYPWKDLSSALTGDGTISSASLGLIVSLIAELAGTSNLTADLRGALNLAADLAGEGDITAAMGALALLGATLSGQGDLEAVLTGILSMSADIVVTGSSLSTANVGAAVWSALAVANNTAGTMGEKLNDAGSASNPWTEIIDGSDTAAEVLTEAKNKADLAFVTNF